MSSQLVKCGLPVAEEMGVNASTQDGVLGACAALFSPLHCEHGQTGHAKVTPLRRESARPRVEKQCALERGHAAELLGGERACGRAE